MNTFVINEKKIMKNACKQGLLNNWTKQLDTFVIKKKIMKNACKQGLLIIGLNSWIKVLKVDK